MTVTGPDFIALEVRDLERAAMFYERELGLRRLPKSPPGAVAFATTPILRAPAAGPFGLMFTFADPDGYAVTIHDQA